MKLKLHWQIIIGLVTGTLFGIFAGPVVGATMGALARRVLPHDWSLNPVTPPLSSAATLQYDSYPI